jgi:hypothetical protein
MAKQVSFQAVDAHVLERLWTELRAHGIGSASGPRQSGQNVPLIEGNPTEQTRFYFLESLYTGLYTQEQDILLRAYVQAHGYSEALRARGYWLGAYEHDLLTYLRNRCERHFLRGE